MTKEPEVLNKGSLLLPCSVCGKEKELVCCKDCVKDLEIAKVFESQYKDIYFHLKMDFAESLAEMEERLKKYIELLIRKK